MKLLNIKKIVFASALIAGGTFTVNANEQPLVKVVDGVAYTITLSGPVSFNSISTTLRASPIWGRNNISLAKSLAIAVGNTPSLGLPNFGRTMGPFFFYATPIGGRRLFTGHKSRIGFAHHASGETLHIIHHINPDSLRYYALVTLGGIPTPLLIPSGPSLTDTQASIKNTAQALQNSYTLQNAILTNGLSYDCADFGANGICVSAGGRNTAVSAANGLNNTSGLLIAAYRPHPNYRVGAYVDENLSVSNAGSAVNLDNSTPLIGLFGAWNERLDGTGTEVKASAAYGQKNATINRSAVGSGDTASEAGSGGSQLNSQGAQVTAKYGFGITDRVIVSPYVGIRYTENNMGGYTEATSISVTAPLTYDALNTNATTALVGVGASYSGITKTTLFASAGVETDTNANNGTYAGSNDYFASGLTPENFNADPVNTRPTATIGATYDVMKNQRIGITGIYRQEAYQAVSTTTVMATYTIGL